MDVAIEVAKCEKAAERVMQSRGPARISDLIATALLEARADATKTAGDRYVPYGFMSILASELLMREVHARRQRGL